MTSFRIRPRFRMTVALSPEAIKSRFQETINTDAAPCIAAFMPAHIILRIPPQEQHFWSPNLELSLQETESGTIIRGLYGPNPQVWTMFTIAYGAMATLSMFISIIGFSQLSLGMEAPVLWVLPVLGSIALLLYILSQTGQKLGAEQTFVLHHFFEGTLMQKVPVY
jgi:hypothetical protein